MSDIPPPDHPLDRFLEECAVLHVAAGGQMLFAASGRCPLVRVLLPGSFNPLHRGHLELASHAEERLGHPVAFELSVVNVDKPSLSRDEICARLTQFPGQVSVWLTHAPRFVEKAACFPGVTFVVGADTALRIVLPRYYANDEEQMQSSLKQLRQLECRFLVACRADARGQCLRQSDLPIPPEFRDLFEEIPPEQFRWDISSTALRALGKAT